MMDIIKPQYLKKGDKVAIVSPAGPVDPELIDGAVARLHKWGFVPQVGFTAKGKVGRFSATDEDRLADLQQAMDDPTVSAILCGRGGYGCLRIVDKLNFDAFAKHPKWLIGFSDVTALHALFQQNGYASVHGAMARALFANSDSAKALCNLLKGKDMKCEVTEASPYNRSGEASAPISGGNLSLLYAMRGTPLDVDMRGKILFIEDLCERMYHIDRMMNNLRLGGVLKNLAGLVVGCFSDIPEDDTLIAAEKVIKDAVAEYDYPVLFGVPVGHEGFNWPIVEGAVYKMTVDEKGGTLELVKESKRCKK
ncbi:MAG: LD-carboxypeptidase [Paludibacteraceae bacterium]|nr:LD-carboxypeptidase [Paludibacteraceae bacterium]